MASETDLVVLLLGIVLAAVYLFRDRLLGSRSSFARPDAASKVSASGANGSAGLAAEGSRNFVEKLKAQKKRIALFYGSQTGTAEEYATKLAKEAKSKFGMSSLVCDPEDYDFEHLDEVPEDTVVFFVVATYGEGEPTDNAVALMDFLNDESVTFSKGGSDLSNLHYVVFALGNRTYEHYNAIGRKIDSRLTELGAKRIGERGEGDDDKSMEEDYLAWKDGMWQALVDEMGFEEGGGGDNPDFKVTELEDYPVAKVYQGELSARALLGTKGIHDAKNPYPAPLKVSRELFRNNADRNCIHAEFDVEGSGISYQHGDHLALWPVNPDVEVERMLAVLGLSEKRDTVIGIESLDPALAKVPFPAPTTYDTIFRHYVDICAIASRQTLSLLSRFAPNEEAAAKLARLGTDKEAYHAEVALPCLRLSQVLTLCTGGDPYALPDPANTTVWNIPFDHIVSDLSRLQPRFYSISSSPKLHPKSIHVTAVVLKYHPKDASEKEVDGQWIYGLGTNYLLNLRMAMNGETEPLIAAPRYGLHGPRKAYTKDGMWKAPVHVRRSNFRLPTSPKIPVIMVGPGTGVAPFRGFVQDRLGSAQKAIEKNGDAALDDWADMSLFFSSRSEDDFLYADEWPEYEKALKGKFKLFKTFTRKNYKPDGGKIYVQDLLWDQRQKIASDILDKKAYFYVCGEAKGMAQDVEMVLAKILAEGKGVDLAGGQAQLKMLKERNRLILDVWS